MNPKTKRYIDAICDEIDSLKARVYELEKRQPAIVIVSDQPKDGLPWWVKAVESTGGKGN